MRMTRRLTVIETPEFRSTARDLFDEGNLVALIDHLALHPLAGELIPGTGGIRKLRWRMEGRGKRGGARVIYYVHGETMPLFLLTAYAKNVRADLSQRERNDFRRLTHLLMEQYGKGRAKR